MREILFRGKRTDNHEWVEGSLFQSEGWAAIGEDGEKSGCYILEKEPLYTRCFMNGNSALADNEFIQVSEKTVGQYTGLKDKNGKRIFEGDILASESCFRKKAVGHIVFGIPSFDPNVETEEPAFGVKWRYEDRGMRTDLNYWAPRAEVIGNIHDNPELMEDSNELD